MLHSICGADCTHCGQKGASSGCLETNGHPFGRECVIAACCRDRGQEQCGLCGGSCQLKAPLIARFNALGIHDMAEVTDLAALQGSYINLTYTLPNGQTVKLLDENKVYLGSQVPKKGSGRCYGLAADENYLLVCEYGENGSEPEIIVFRRKW